MVWIHPSWILLHGHQEDVLLFVGGVQREDAHHDEVREEEELGKANTPTIIIIIIFTDSPSSFISEFLILF